MSLVYFLIYKRHLEDKENDNKPVMVIQPFFFKELYYRTQIRRETTNMNVKQHLEDIMNAL